ncbi:amidase signature domain-containing protein [Tricladium varicosporioides]|nr:amidase signature domain-containing protein [Hymenoscyphus varicosporioides]
MDKYPEGSRLRGRLRKYQPFPSEPSHSREKKPESKQFPSLSLQYKILLATMLFFPFVIYALIWNLAESGTLIGTLPMDLLDAGAEELIAGLESGSWTSVDLTKAYIARIQEVNPILHAVTEINPDALFIAASMDAERAGGMIRSPLHGIPILIKNNIATKDQMSNTAGSYLLLNATVPRDAHVVAKLRAAGVVILGKSNLSQWANFRSSNSSNGWSAYGGQVTGAYYPNMDPSGSSSGSGVGSSIGLAFASLGTETSGSILSPSDKNNLVGIKPTVGLTSRALVIPISEHQDTVGPMARTVTDAAYVLSIIAGKDTNDNYTWSQPWNTSPDYRRALKFSSLRGARIGIPRNVFSASSTNGPVLQAFEESIQVLKRAGAVIVDNSNYSAYGQYLADSSGVDNAGIVLGADFVSNLATYLSKLTSNPLNIKNLADVSTFTESFPPEKYPDRDTAIWDQALSLGYNNTDFRFWEAYQFTSFLGGEGGVTGALRRNNLSALILPTRYAAVIPALAGLPVVTVPMGFYPANTTVIKSARNLVQIGPNMPFGLSFLGPAWSEETLISFAYAFEQRTHARLRVKPYLVPNTQLSPSH